MWRHPTSFRFSLQIIFFCVQVNVLDEFKNFRLDWLGDLHNKAMVDGDKWCGNYGVQ